MRNTVGRMSSTGKSPMIRDMKYEERVYIPEALSFMKIARSWGNAKTALTDGKTPQKTEMKKKRPNLSWTSRKSECHHMIPDKSDAAITWKTLRVFKDSCFLSLRLLWRRMLNWFNQVAKPITLLLWLLVCSSEEWLLLLLPVRSASLLGRFVASMQAALTFGANNVLYEATMEDFTFGFSLSLTPSRWYTPRKRKKYESTSYNFIQIVIFIWAYRNYLLSNVNFPSYRAQLIT